MSRMPRFRIPDNARFWMPIYSRISICEERCTDLFGASFFISVFTEYIHTPKTILKEVIIMKTNLSKSCSNRNCLILSISIDLLLAITIGLTSCSSFSLIGKWKNVGDASFGQIQPGDILVFDGVYCNLYSPKDTYAFSSTHGSGQLDITSFLFNEQLSFTIEIINNNKITICNDSTILKMEKVT